MARRVGTMHMSNADEAPTVAAAGWFMTGEGYRWWDGSAWSSLPPPPAGDDVATGRTLAVLCHLGLFLGGFILPLVVYLTEGPRNRYTRHHSREALNFNITFVMLWMLLFMPAWIVIILTTAGNSTRRSGFPISIAIFWIAGMLLWLTAISFSILGAVRASQGRQWRYPLCVRFVRDRDPTA